MNLQRLLVIVCLGLGMFATGVPRARAQGNTLSPKTVTSPDLNDDQKAEVKAFVNANEKGLSGDPLEIKKSRNTFLQPFKNQQVSVAFRLEYTRDLVPVLRPLLASESEVIAVNAARVAGELATAGSVELLADALNDKREGVRYAAASGFENTFKAMQGTVPALGGTPALRMVDTVKAGLVREKNPRVMEGLVLALQEASRVSEKQVEGMRDAGVKALSEAVVAKVADRKISPDADPALRRAILTVRLAVTNQNINAPSLQRSTLLAGAEMAGDLLGVASERMKAESGADADLALMVKEAETAIFFIQSQLAANPPPKDFKVWQQIQQGNSAEYLKQVLQIIGPNGILTTAPFNFKDDRFIKNP